MPNWWLLERPLILASGSSTRATLLERSGIPIQPINPNIDERAIEQALQREGADGERVARTLALTKAREVSLSHPGRIVLGADQTLRLGGQAFSKPSGRAQAKQQLQMLAGWKHRLFSAAVIVVDGQPKFQTVETAELTMRRCSDQFLDWYLDACGDSIFGSVGAYQIEGFGGQLFKRVEGAQDVIMGLPLRPLFSFFRRVGYLLA